jgi:hypothetical protein
MASCRFSMVMAVGGGREVAVAECREATDVVGRGGAHDARRPPDGDDVARQRRPGRDEGALAEEHAISEARTGHEDRGVPDLAQVAHDRSQDLAAVPERRATADDRRDIAVADDDGVLDHGRPGPDFDTRAGGADDRTLGEQRSLTEARPSQHDGGGRDVQRAGLGLADRTAGSGTHGEADPSGDRPRTAPFRNTETGPSALTATTVAVGSSKL